MYVYAILCSICKSYQDKWRTIILYIASTTGFIALFASAITFVASNVAELTHTYMWQDNADVLYFVSGNSPRFHIVIANTGDGEIFVRELRIYWRRGNISYPIDAAVDVARMYTTSNAVDVLEELRKSRYHEFIANRTGNVNAEVIGNSRPGIEEESLSHARFLAVFFSSNAGDIARMNDHYRAYNAMLVSEPVDATLYFYSAHSRRLLEVNVPMVVTFLRHGESKCMEISID